jgi:hypothetical protein
VGPPPCRERTRMRALSLPATNWTDVRRTFRVFFLCQLTNGLGLSSIVCTSRYSRRRSQACVFVPGDISSCPQRVFFFRSGSRRFFFSKIRRLPRIERNVPALPRHDTCTSRHWWDPGPFRDCFPRAQTAETGGRGGSCACVHTCRAGLAQLGTQTDRMFRSADTFWVCNAFICFRHICPMMTHTTTSVEYTYSKVSPSVYVFAKNKTAQRST